MKKIVSDTFHSLKEYLKAKAAGLKLTNGTPILLPVYLRDEDTFMKIEAPNRLEVIFLDPEFKSVIPFGSPYVSYPYKMLKAGKLAQIGFQEISDQQYYEARVQATGK